MLRKYRKIVALIAILSEEILLAVPGLMQRNKGKGKSCKNKENKEINNI